MFLKNCLLSFALGLVCGIIPVSYLLARIKGVDLKTVGSGNIGATNLGRSLGLGFFLLGFFLDGLKGLVPVLIARAVFPPAILAGLGAILGHIFNPLFDFRGGKGVSTTIGVAAGLSPISFGVAIGAWVIIYLLTYLVSLASIVSAVVLPLAAVLIREAGIWDRVVIAMIAGLVIYAHRSNIGRLLKGDEPKTVFWSGR
jgi:glycerol-3-phosphate acyltransferase PlsY